MLFNSNEFLLFFVVFATLYFSLSGRPSVQNVLIVLASFLFYGTWSVPFLGLMCLTGTADYFIALAIDATKSRVKKKAILAFSLLLNLGILGYFKYGGFALDILNSWFPSPSSERIIWSVILPVGISFYTFQSISYVIDIYRGSLRPERNWITFMAFLTFFPQLVAGPIERAGHLLPQFKRSRETTETDLDEATWLLLWGFFKKVVIADNLAPSSDLVFSSDSFPMVVYLAGTLAFGIQIYCDFSGYSDIARGLGKFFGFDIMFNFRVPYFATSLREFWQRWHISLSGWFRDYLYIPLGGNRGTFVKTCCNLFLVMVIAGVWHGANWTFILWGIWHGAALLANHLWARSGRHVPVLIGWLLTTFVVFVGWLFFRASSLEQLYAMFFENHDAAMPLWVADLMWGVGVLAAPLVVIEAMHHLRKSLIWPQTLSFIPKSLLYGAIVAVTMFFWEKEGTPFIYFQF